LGTDFWKKYLDQTLYAIVEITANKNAGEITVKKIRQVHGVQPSNRSAINFYARTLIYLKDNGVLKSVGNNSRSPRKYALKNKEKLVSLVKVKSGNLINNKYI
jgi:hypothetical protein